MSSPIRGKRRVDALFRAMSSDFLLREQFVTDPAQILNEYVMGKRLDPDEASAANHLLYAVMSRPGLVDWLRSYANQGTKAPTGDQFTRDFARALAADGDEQTLLAVLRAANESQDLFSVQSEVLRQLIDALAGGRGGRFAGTEMSSPGTEMSPGRVFAGTEMSSPGTEMSPGHGTEMSPGRVFAGTEMSSPGTEMSPGHGTEMSPGRVFAGTEMSSPGTEMSPGHGTEMSPGRVFAGTEMSSPGTEMSPGHGTEMSPGRLGGIDIDVTLHALTNFATELRRAGELNTVRFR